jgi:hypothetical protein
VQVSAGSRGSFVGSQRLRPLAQVNQDIANFDVCAAGIALPFDILWVSRDKLLLDGLIRPILFERLIELAGLT